jgi:CDP-glycerol glycerophosphotransferase (TagB/SpsB family)
VCFRAKRVKHLNKPYSFEVIKIELFDLSSNSSILDVKVADSYETDLLSVAKLLQNVEKSYDKGKFLLEESKKSDAWDAIFRRF